VSCYDLGGHRSLKYVLKIRWNVRGKIKILFWKCATRFFFWCLVYCDEYLVQWNGAEVSDKQESCWFVCCVIKKGHFESIQLAAGVSWHAEILSWARWKVLRIIFLRMPNLFGLDNDLLCSRTSLCWATLAVKCDPFNSSRWARFLAARWQQTTNLLNVKYQPLLSPTKTFKRVVENEKF